MTNDHKIDFDEV